MKLSLMFVLIITLTLIMRCNCVEEDLNHGFSCILRVADNSRHSKACQLQYTYVHLDWMYDDVHYPRSVQIRTCQGHCSELESSLRYRMISQSMMESPVACCIPTAYTDQRVYYINKTTNLVSTGILKNAVATQCGCCI